MLSILCLPLLALTASGQSSASLISLTPAKSVAVLRVNWAQVRGDAELKNFVKGDGFAATMQKFGLQESQISEWIVFSGINPTASGDVGMIFSGSFTTRDISAVAQKNNWNAEKIGAQAVFSDSDDSFVAPVRDGLAAAGSRSAIENVLKIIGKTASGLSGKPPFKDLTAQLGDGNQAVNFMLGVPPDYQNEADFIVKIVSKLLSFTGFGLLGTVLEKVGAVRALGFSVTNAKNGFPMQLVAALPSENSAALISGGLNFLKNLPRTLMSGGSSTNDKANTEALQSMTFANNGALLSVKFTFPRNEILRSNLGK